MVPAAQQVIDIRDVSFTFPSSENGDPASVLTQVSFSVSAGEFVCLLGPSGCGKTTLLQLIADLLPQQQGIIRLARPRGWCSSVVPCTMLFQDLNLFYWLTATRNVELALRARGVARRRRAQEAVAYLNQVGLNGFGNYYPHELSGGMRQRLAIARALATAAPTLLLDEPFSNLDSITQQAIEADLLRLWNDKSLTILMITHEVAEAVRLADRVVVLSPRPATVQGIIEIGLPRPRPAKLMDLPQFKHIEELLCRHPESH
jgi:NitT/TauT family transport system ATP-binding protein